MAAIVGHGRTHHRKIIRRNARWASALRADQVGDSFLGDGLGAAAAQGGGGADGAAGRGERRAFEEVGDEAFEQS